MAGLSSAMWIVGSYIVMIILLYAVLNFLTKGFIGQYLKVKMSRGRLVLVKCHDVTDSFYKAGKIDPKKNLVVKDRQNGVHTFSKMDMNYVKRELGMNCIEVNLVKGIVVKADFSASTGFDLTMVDEMVNRALMLPKFNNSDMWAKMEKLFFIIIIVGIGVIIYLLLSQPTPSLTCPVAGVNI